MTTQKNDTNKTSTAPNTNRRNIAFNLLGLLGGSVLLKACAAPESGDSSDNERLATAVQGLTGSSLRWADTIFGANGPTDRTGGDLNNPPQGPNPPVVMIVKGANAPGDGGGGVFFWDSTVDPDDGGTVIVPRVNPTNIPGCWRRIYEGPLNVKWFGTVNARLAIQNAIDSAEILAPVPPPVPPQLGSRVYVPPGTYGITQAIEMKTGVELFGAGVSSVLIRAGGGASGNFDDAVIKGIGVQDVRIANLKIDGNKTSWVSDGDLSQQSGIVLVPAGEDPCKRALVENCIVTECVGHGILLIWTEEVRVFGCSVKNNGANGVLLNNGLGSTIQSCESFHNFGVGIQVDGDNRYGAVVRDNRTDSVLVTTSQVSIIGCRVINNPSTPHEACIVIKPPVNAPTATPNYVTVTNCHLKTTTYGIKVAGESVNNPGVGNIINGNIVTEDLITYDAPISDVPKRHGIGLTYQRDTSVVNNNISGTTAAFSNGIECLDCQHVSIGDNAIASMEPSGLDVFGVSLVGTSDTTVTGNAIRGFAKGAFEDTSNPNTNHNIVSANILKNNVGAFGNPGAGSIYDHNII